MIRSKKPLIAFTNYHSQEPLGSTLVDTVWGGLRVQQPEWVLRTAGGSFAVIWCLHSMTSKHLRPRCRKRWLFGYFSSLKKCLRLGETECRLMLLWASKVTSLFVYFFAIKKVRRLVMPCAEIQATKEVIFKRKPPLKPPGRAHNHVCQRRTWCLVRVTIEIVQMPVLSYGIEQRL